MIGFDFAPWTFAVGVVSLILIALNFYKIRQISFTHTITSSPEQMISELPVGVTLGAINTSDNPIIPLYIDGNVSIGDNVINLITTSLVIERGSRRYPRYDYKDKLEFFGLISDPPTNEEIERILQKEIKLSTRYSYYRFHLLGKNFFKREKIYNVVWDRRTNNWRYLRPDEKIA